MKKIEAITIPPQGRELFMHGLHNPLDKGWHFGSGDPELWKFRDRLLVPNGKLLDLGIGVGRLSMSFALQGMQVTGYETNPLAIQEITPLITNNNLPISLKEEDIRTADLGENSYDTVLLGQTLVHAGSKQDAFGILEKAFRALKPGGSLWMRATGNLDARYNELVRETTYEDSKAARKDADTFIALCHCSGEAKKEPFLYLDPVETLAFFAQHDMDFVHTQTLPTPNNYNIMYPEDWNYGFYPPRMGGMITILATKRDKNS